MEVDGEHHQTEERRSRDERRDPVLAERGYVLLRIPGYEVLQDPAGARRRIEDAIDHRLRCFRDFRPLTPNPSPPAS